SIIISEISDLSVPAKRHAGRSDLHETRKMSGVSGGRPRQPGGVLSTGAILTTHRILGAFGRDPRTFDILHADLFDSRHEVVLSALRALAGTKDERSFMYVARLFRHPDP